MFRTAAVAMGALVVFGTPANARWELVPKKDPFSGKATAEMLNLAQGWAVGVSIGCTVHGYLALTIALRTEMPRGVGAFQRDIKVQVRVDDLEVHDVEAEMYSTTASKLAIRTKPTATLAVRKIIDELEDADERIAVRTDVMESFAEASASGSTRAAQAVKRACGD